VKHKVDISEVIEFSDELKTASEDIKSSLKKVEENIEQINAMESFSGKAAKEAKGYFNDLHKTILESFNGLFTDLDNNLKKHLESFQLSVDRNESAIIESDYLKDTEEDISDDYEKLSEEQESIRETISSVSDISSANHPISWTLDSDKDDATKIITKLEEKLDSFTRKEDDSQTKELLHQIEVAMKNAKTNDGTARFIDYKGDSKNVGLPELKDYNQAQKEEVMEKAKEAKDSAIKDLNGPSQALLNQAYTKLKNGEIDSDKYYDVLSVLKKTKGNLSEEELNEEVPEGFVEYLNENRAQIARDLGVPIGASTMEYKGTVKVGAFIQRFKAIPGPAGPKSFNMVNSKSAHVASPFFKADSPVRTAGKAIGKGFIGLGFGLGMYSDIAKKDKTWGEAITHNVVATGIGVGSTMGTATVLTTAATAVIGATPVGCAAVAVGIAAGATVVGVVATNTFNYLYDHNILGFQDGLDWAGQQIDEGFRSVKETATNFAEDVGEAFQSGLDAINPFG